MAATVSTVIAGGCTPTAVGAISVGPPGSGADYTFDGVDDQVQLQAAIDAAASSATKQLVVVSGQLQFGLNGVVAKSNVRVVGQGMGLTTITMGDLSGLTVTAGALPGSTTNGNIFYYPPGTSTDNFSLEDLTLDGNRAINSALEASGLQDAACNGLRVAGTGATRHTDIRCTNVEAKNCVFMGLFLADYVIGASVVGCDTHHNGFRGVHCHASSTTAQERLIIKDNRCHENGQSTGPLQNTNLSGLFVVFDNNHHVTLIGNEVYDEPAVGLDLTGSGGADPPATDSIVSNNQILRCGSGINLGSGLRRVTIQTNVIRSMRTQAADGTKLAGATGTGILFSGGYGCEDLKFLGNAVTDCSGAALSQTTPTTGYNLNIDTVGNTFNYNVRDVIANTDAVQIIQRGGRFSGNTIRHNGSQLTGPVIEVNSASISTANDTIPATAHGLSNGDVVYILRPGDTINLKDATVYRSSSAGVIPGGTAFGFPYYAIGSGFANVDANNFALASSYANAIAGTKVNISAQSGTIGIVRGTAKTVSNVAVVTRQLIVTGCVDLEVSDNYVEGTYQSSVPLTLANTSSHLKAHDNTVGANDATATLLEMFATQSEYSYKAASWQTFRLNANEAGATGSYRRPRQNVLVQAIAASQTIPDNLSDFVLTGATATATVTFPANPFHGQLLCISFTGVTVYTFAGNGKTIVGTLTGTSAAGSSGIWVYDTPTTTWYPRSGVGI